MQKTKKKSKKARGLTKAGSRKMVLQAIKTVCNTSPNEVLEVLLKEPFAPSVVAPDVTYERREDGITQVRCMLSVNLWRNGNVRLSIMPTQGKLGQFVDFSLSNGGSPLVRSALLFLGAAIATENKERPQAEQMA